MNKKPCFDVFYQIYLCFKDSNIFIHHSFVLKFHFTRDFTFNIFNNKNLFKVSIMLIYCLKADVAFYKFSRL